MLSGCGKFCFVFVFEALNETSVDLPLSGIMERSEFRLCVASFRECLNLCKVGRPVKTLKKCKVESLVKVQSYNEGTTDE